MVDTRALPPYLTIGIDGSPSAHAALDWGLAEAHRRALAVQLVTAWWTPLMVAGPASALAIPTMMISARTGARRVVDAAARQAAALGVECTTEVIEGDPAEGLATLSRGADQLVVGAHGRSAAIRHLLGSVSAAAVRRAHGPVTVVRHQPEHARHRVVVGVDGSDHSEVALRRAAVEAGAARAQLSVVTAWHPLNADLIDEFSGSHIPTDSDLCELAEARARALMERNADRLRSIPAHLSVLHGTAADVLSDESAHADLLVVGTRGWGAFDRMLFGSTSSAVLHRASCPVQVVPSTL